MSNAVRLELDVTADTKQAAAAFDDVGTAAKGMASDVDKAARDAGSGMSGFSESADGAGSAAATAAGAFGDLGGALAMMPGPLGALGAGMETAAPAIQGVTGATDLMSLAMNSSAIKMALSTTATIAQTVAQKAASVATKAFAIAQWALNAALTANPIGVIVVLLVALVAGLVLAWKKSDAFRAAVKKLGDVAVAAFNAIKTAMTAVWSFIKDKLAPIFSVFATAAATAIDKAKTVIKSLDPVALLRKNWSGIKGFLTKPFEDAWAAIKGLFGSGGAVSNIGSAAVSAVRNMCNDVIDLINKLINAFNKLPGPDIPTIGHVSSASTQAAASRAVGATRAAASTTAAAAGGGVVINIYGAVDTYGTAQQIRRVLTRGAIIGGTRR